MRSCARAGARMGSAWTKPSRFTASWSVAAVNRLRATANSRRLLEVTISEIQYYFPALTYWNANIQYHGLILAALPAGASRVLDAGCGDGILAAELVDAG